MRLDKTLGVYIQRMSEWEYENDKKLVTNFFCFFSHHVRGFNSNDEVSELEKADAYLESKDYQNAVDSYNKVISSDSDDYVSYRKLAAAYAGLAGFNLMDVVADSLGDIITGQGSARI